MYTRRCFRRNCHCNTIKPNPCDLETMCDNVVNNSCCDDENDCECGYDDNYYDDVFPENPMFAQSYVPIQTMDKTFKPCIGLRRGTIFPELVDEYYPCQSIDLINYIKETNTIGEGCNK